MRIRRNASKLLGSTTLYAIPPPPSTGCAAAAAAVDAEYRVGNNNNNNNNNNDDDNNVCELNCSPWDLLLLNLDSNLDDYFLTDHSQEQEDKGIFGNLIKTEQEEQEEPILPSSSSAAELAVGDAMRVDEKKLAKQEKRRRKKKTHCKGKGDQDSTAETPTNNNSNSYCKKSDGKGWHCKQRAELPHSLCSHHIAQVRSYTSSFNHQASPASKAEAIDGVASGADNYNSDPSDLYYYYEGFRPWRGKRRGSIPACNRPVNNNNNNNNSTCDGNDEETKDREERDEDRSSCEIKMHGGDGGDNANVAGDEGCDLDRFDDGDKDEDYRMKQDDDQSKKRPAVIKKRGRKPFKCRSLKSLL